MQLTALKSDDTAIWIGRYQPFHIGHSRIVDRSVSELRCSHFIGIVCYDQNSEVRPSEVKHRQTSGLFTPRERLTMTRLGLARLPSSTSLEIAYVPYLAPDRWQLVEGYLPENPVFCVTNKDEADLKRIEAFQSLGRRCAVLDVTDLELHSGTSIQAAIRAGSDWRQFFETETHDFFESIRGPQRLAE